MYMATRRSTMPKEQLLCCQCWLFKEEEEWIVFNIIPPSYNYSTVGFCSCNITKVKVLRSLVLSALWLSFSLYSCISFDLHYTEEINIFIFDWKTQGTLRIIVTGNSLIRISQFLYRNCIKWIEIITYYLKCIFKFINVQCHI